MRQIFIDNVQEFYKKTLSQILTELYIQDTGVNSWIIDALERNLFILAFDCFREGRLAALTDVADIIEDYEKKYKKSLKL